ncbi:MAG: MurR/RpiR family transcriptional regulator [Flaviflexus sp.]|nr:MurR/RpiR family transcriptional regulator [Flaviflexus ciconiae]
MTAAPLSAVIRRKLPDLQPAMRRVGEIIVADPSRVSTMSIGSLAVEAKTSETTVVRFCREVGVAGYSELRIGLAHEAGARSQAEEVYSDTGDILPSDSLNSVVKKIAYADLKSVEDTSRMLSLSDLSAVVADVVAAERIQVFGVGASGLVALDFEQKLERIGLVTDCSIDPHRAITIAALATDKTVTFGFSHSGSTVDTLEALRIAGANGATTVGVTNSPDSPLAKMADKTLLTAARETTFRSGATGSRLAQLMIVDCLFVAIAQQTFEASIRALEVTRAAIEDSRSRRHYKP